MSDIEFRDKVKNAVYAEHGLRLADNDPVFSVILANKLFLDETGHSLQRALKDLPRAIEQTILKVVLAVEDSEKTVDSLRSEAKGMLTTLAKIELENAHKQIKESITVNTAEAIGASTKSFQDTIAVADKKIKELSAEMNGKQLLITNLMLGVALAFTIIFSGVGGYYLYQLAQDGKRDSMMFYKLSERQQKAIDTLPAALRKQLNDQVNAK